MSEQRSDLREAAAGQGGGAPESPLAAHSREIRRLAHDLSNALEIILQSSYLLGTAEMDPAARQWVDLLGQGVERAAGINQELREYIRRNL